MKKGYKLTILSSIGLILGLISTFIGWMGWGGYIFGIPAILLGLISLIFGKTRKSIIVLSVFSLILGGVGMAETTAGLLFVTGMEEATKQSFGPTTTKEGAKIKITNYDLIISNDLPTLKVNFNSNFDGYLYLYRDNEYITQTTFSKEDFSEDLDLSSLGCNFENGNYTLKILTWDEKPIKTFNFSIKGSVKIDNVTLDIANETFHGLQLRLIRVEIANNKNVPIQVTRLAYIINGKMEEESFLDWVVPPSTTKDFVSQIYRSLDSGDKIEKVELEDDCGEVLGTYTLNYTVP